LIFKKPSGIIANIFRGAEIKNIISIAAEPKALSGILY